MKELPSSGDEAEVFSVEIFLSIYLEFTVLVFLYCIMNVFSLQIQGVLDSDSYVACRS
ncbi:hypothetical protein WN55_01453 [Dufourea novaeangliae]|uniref:Uncharacterized protein n=1 Tax=Dufourea novaeangliae TaxID=178035 RepID=A0A154PEV5_DUFNO|nr:hypothetical protein WN55_01453 [Dufourea novaeangliae]